MSDQNVNEEVFPWGARLDMERVVNNLTGEEIRKWVLNKQWGTEFLKQMREANA